MNQYILDKDDNIVPEPDLERWAKWMQNSTNGVVGGTRIDAIKMHQAMRIKVKAVEPHYKYVIGIAGKVNIESGTLYRYKDENDNGEWFCSNFWQVSIPPSMTSCIKVTPAAWKCITEFEAIELFPEAFQQQDIEQSK